MAWFGITPSHWQTVGTAAVLILTSTLINLATVKIAAMFVNVSALATIAVRSSDGRGGHRADLRKPPRQQSEYAVHHQRPGKGAQSCCRFFVLVIDPGLLTDPDDYRSRVSAYADSIRATRLVEGGAPVRVPFDRSAAQRPASLEAGVVAVPAQVWAVLSARAVGPGAAGGAGVWSTRTGTAGFSGTSPRPSPS